LTEFNECGSLEDVLNQVRQNDPPPFWNNETITKIIFSLVTGLEYLHCHGIVHHELKPSDVIVQGDGTAKICGYMTSYLEQHKFTRASQVRPPFHAAPEVYNADDDDDHDDQDVKRKDPKTDVFAFGLIAFELVSITRVFPLTMAPVTIMRKAMSSKPVDRPKLANGVPGVLADLIRRCWVPVPSKRPVFSDILHQLNAIEFRFFPHLNLRLTMPLSVPDSLVKSGGRRPPAVGLDRLVNL
jgi:serine/threonine protein kinase